MATIPARIGAVLVVVFALIGSACAVSAAIDERSERADSPTGIDAATVEPPPERLSLLPESMMDDVGNLQQAIDLALDRDVARCMREQGYPYQSTAVGAQPQFDYDPIRSAMIEIGVEQQRPLEGPNSKLIEDMTADEFDAWDLASIDCQIGSDLNNENPLGDFDWYADIYAAASDLTQADPRFIESRDAADRCYEAAGFGPRGEAHNRIASEIAAVSANYRNGALLTQADAHKQLIALGEELLLIEQLGDDCYRENHSLTGRIFDGHLEELALNSPELPSYVANIEASLEDYRGILDEISAEAE